uniref:ZSWIM1/3 RNaseH-like domain-containing protein n=1 Tax=Amphimedon queenslandica TaxID=400682 RepID=A0A1X7SDX4_AMPQE
MLMKFGSEAICMDSTHSTNVYDFCLVTILVLDDFGEGVPVGWMISNREDAAALRQFLLKIRPGEKEFKSTSQSNQNKQKSITILEFYLKKLPK